MIWEIILSDENEREADFNCESVKGRTQVSKMFCIKLIKFHHVTKEKTKERANRDNF